jgi:hypothetical protein
MGESESIRKDFLNFVVLAVLLTVHTETCGPVDYLIIRMSMWKKNTTVQTDYCTVLEKKHILHTVLEKKNILDSFWFNPFTYFQILSHSPYIIRRHTGVLMILRVSLNCETRVVLANEI